ncbi:serine hydrolase domain-containing protein [Jejudonia soesokkakensis]|uniref:Serine hydrolase domain-containing protein n=1 Tax=Jejudonia soesokkakensis TaxID=1323432 RepID=A0ABW2MWW5_9FLAO
MKYLLLLLGFLIACSSDNNSTEEIVDDMQPMETLYFPPINSSEWQTTTISEQNWNESALPELTTFLSETNTEAFIILKDGKIVVEEYYNGASNDDFQPWNSAGKTLTAFTVGIAENEGLLSIENMSSQFLGEGWTSMSLAQENTIQLFHQLTMTSGGDYTVDNTACYDPECLRYLSDPGTFWYYHNAFYTLLQPVLDAATPTGFTTYFSEKVKDKIGMNGAWITLGYNNVYFSSARSMARFGLLNLNKGAWKEEQLIDASYFEAMTNTSQELNKSYGYLWWLNGKESYRLPQSTAQFSGTLIPNAPSDLIAGLGKDDQKLYVIPSKNMVVVRMGGNGGSELLGPSGYDNNLWGKISALIN